MNYTDRGPMMAEMTPRTPVPDPVVLQAVRAVLNGSQIISVPVMMGFKDSGSQALNLTIAVDKTTYAFVKNLGRGQTQAVTATLSAYRPTCRRRPSDRRPRRADQLVILRIPQQRASDNCVTERTDCGSGRYWKPRQMRTPGGVMTTRSSPSLAMSPPTEVANS